MFNLSTQEVVLSIENSIVENNNGLVYQTYPNFFGNTLDWHFGEKENFEKLENQSKLNRKKLPKEDNDMKKITVFFMNSKITRALEKKFDTDLKFESVDIWIDEKGYKLQPHVDDKRIKLHLQVYLSDHNKGTSLYDSRGNVIFTFPFRTNYGYALLNNEYSHHGVEEIENNGRTSLYVRYQ